MLATSAHASSPINPEKNLQSQKRVAGPIDGMDQMVSAPNSPDSFFSDSGVTTNGGIFAGFCGFIIFVARIYLLIPRF